MKLATLNTVNLAYIVKTYSDDPVGFCRDILGIKEFDEWQEWFLNETLTFGDGGKKIAIASCHGSGKTMFASAISIHRITCFSNCQGKITSATYNQLIQAFHGTIEKMISESLISDWFIVNKTSIKLKGIQDSWIMFQAWSLNLPESFAGNHAYSPFLIVDEASAVAPVIFESFDGSMMHPNSLLIMLGNPLVKNGQLYDAFHCDKHFFKTRYVSALDSQFVPDWWIENMKQKYGEDSDTYRVRVLGQFPINETGAFIPQTLIEEAMDREPIISKRAPVVAGLDIGRLRDKSVLFVRQGTAQVYKKKWETRDTMTVAEDVFRLIIELNIQAINVDANGVGAGVADRLRQMLRGTSINCVIYDVDGNGNFGDPSKPGGEKEYTNKRTKLWGKAKAWLKYGSLMRDPDLVDGGAALLYTYDRYGRWVLESKELAAKRKVSSPDDFDAFAYSFGVDVVAVKNSQKVTKEKKLVLNLF